MNGRKLTLHRETLRNLQDSDLRQVVGGTIDGITGACGDSNPCVFSGADCPMITGNPCACGSSMTDTGGVVGGAAQQGA